MNRILLFLYLFAVIQGVAFGFHEVIPNCYLYFSPKYRQQVEFTADSELRVLSYNTLNLRRQIGQYVDKNGKRVFKKVNEAKPEWQTKWIANIIKRENADIVFLQEVEGRQVAYDFNRIYLNNEYQIFYTGGNDPRGINIAILVHKRLPFDYEIHSHRKLKMKDPTPGKDGEEVGFFSRDFPVVLVKNKKEDPLFLLGGVHLKSQRQRGADPNSYHLRDAQVKNTLKIVGDYIDEYNNIPMLIAGDFNADLRAAPEFNVLRKGRILKDSFESVKPPVEKNQRITHSFHPRGGTTNYNQLDGIFHRNMEVKEAKVLRYKDPETGQERPLPRTWKQREKNPSDHFPIMSVVKLKRNQQ